ncbi:hypothetical protein [Gimesia maris]|uniref:hypothetical protein n=1 Tax=Gimesia maris TaxID=122 RepID=UPI003A91FBDD
MSQYLRIHAPNERSYYTETTEKARKKLAKEIEDHNKNVAEYQAAKEKIKNNRPEDLSPEELFDGAASVRFLHGLYKRALQLCDQIFDFSKLHQKDRHAEHRRVSDELKSKRKLIREQLTEIGYATEDVLPSHRQQVELFSMIHPDIISLRQTASSLSGADHLEGGDPKMLRFELEKLVARHTVSA